VLSKKPVKEELEKLALEFEEAGATNWDALKIIQELENEKLQGKKMREKAIELLTKLNPKAAEVFSSFEKMRVFTSKEKIEAFNRGNITKSLTRETKIPRTIAEKISSEVEGKLKDLNVKELSTPLIRDMAAVKLLEFGQIKTYYEYTRLGMPIFDVEKKMQAGKKAPKEIMRQYNLLKTIPQKAKELHSKGIISIYGIPDIVSRPFATSIFPGILSENFPKALVEIQGIFLKSIHANTLNPSISGINACFAKAAGKKTKTEISDFAETLAESLQQLYSLKKTRFLPLVGIDLFFQPESGLSARQKENATEFGLSFLKTFHSKKERAFSVAVCIDSKYKLKLLKDINEDTLAINCFKGKTSIFTKEFFAKQSTINQVVEINLESFASGNDPSTQEKALQACRATQEIFSEKEKMLPGKKAENIVLLKGVSAFLEKSFQTETEKTAFLASLKKCFGENITAIARDKDNPGQPEKNTAFLLLKNGIQKMHKAKNIDEVEELFSNNALACIYSGKGK